ncbi:conserved hypothetical protein [Beggiatoa sp. PS]|nr:conserved hypothetical protein [Beggiatoa sp. PS]
MEYYLRVEAVNLSNFIYDTTDLSTVRGGGLLLLDAINKIEEHFEQLKGISTGASSGLFSFTAPDKQAADEIQKQVISFLVHDKKLNEHVERLKHATFVVDILPITETENEFDKAREKLLALNRWQQMQSPTLVFPDNKQQDMEHPVCGIDHVRPSSATREIPRGNDNKPIIVSESVYQRHNYGHGQKQKFYEQQTGLKDLRDFVTDLTQLADAEDNDKIQSNLDGKMAVIYLDGNSFGSLQRGLDEKGLREFDDKIKEYRRDFLCSLLQEITKSKDSQDSAWFYGTSQKIRLETLLWGGDELMLVVPAWKGWWTLNFFFEASKQWRFRDNSLTHAAGLVFCHHNAPIHRIRGLAYQLGDLAKAKKDAQGNKIGRTDNYVAYQVLESFDHTGLDLEDFRKKSLGQSGLRADELIIRGDEMGSLGELMAKTKEVLPKGRVYKIIDTIIGKPTEPKELIDANEKEQKALITKAKELLDDNLQDSPFFKEVIVWLHLIELWDYIETVEKN